MQEFGKKHRNVDPCGTILESVADGVFTVDKDFTITFFNRSAEKITGVSRQIAVGKKCHEVFRTKICQTGCVLRRSIETGKDGAHARINILNSKGTVVPISIETSVLRDYDGAMAVIEAGAERIGASAGVAIVNHQSAEGTGY